ncbi:Uncharacterized mitochondrial protein AtMg00820 [Striga hermonthica]|uniref:Uncharacterized mitochondrial protein AtMg00820 n=1 Tax=Striga hermonthica TaxID=68872 RepID=A0A9N7N7Y8_STRHE|nr:Uncharacterized mitochondrial protein AtMg00820 [Striga hermonthica]
MLMVFFLRTPIHFHHHLLCRRLLPLAAFVRRVTWSSHPLFHHLILLLRTPLMIFLTNSLLMRNSVSNQIPRHELLLLRHAHLLLPCIRCKLEQSQVSLNLDILPPLTVHLFSLLLRLLTEPRGITTALKYPEWVRAMLEELSALKANNTWSLVSRPSSTNTVDSRWVFCTKLLADGSVDRYKARLVAQGFSQIPGFDHSHLQSGCQSIHYSNCSFTFCYELLATSPTGRKKCLLKWCTLFSGLYGTSPWVH